jgi:transposase-like protein
LVKCIPFICISLGMGVKCPHCQNSDIAKCGFESWTRRQRYFCHNCKKRFQDICSRKRPDTLSDKQCPICHGYNTKKRGCHNKKQRHPCDDCKRTLISMKE